MLVKIKRYNLGGFIFEPVNRQTVKGFHADMIENGCNPIDCRHDLLLHYEDIADLVNRSQFKDLDEGWDITIRVDNWTVRQYFGYCCN